MDDPLPSFKKPPVVETAVSVQFKPLSEFRNGHLGLFWRQIRKDFRNSRDAIPIEPQEEQFGSDVARRARLPSLRIGAVRPAARLQMTSEDDHTMIQVQNGLLAYNWLRRDEGEYPRWHRVRRGFEGALDKFRAFLKSEDIGDIEPNQWEVTYVNHLLRGREWNSPVDWAEVLPGLIGTAAHVTGGKLETIAGKCGFALPDRSGRLHVDLAHAYTGPDEEAQEILVLQLTARGKADNEGRDLNTGLQIGHHAIVRTFSEITGERAQTIWERDQ